MRMAVSFAVGLLLGGILTRRFTPQDSTAPSAGLLPPAQTLVEISADTSTRRGRRARRPRRARQRRSYGETSSQQSVSVDEASTRGPYYGDLARPGELQRAVDAVSLNGELVLLHGDFHRLRMLVNLIANLNDLGIYHILLLGFNKETCSVLAHRHRISCAHSSFLWDVTAAGEAGELARRRAHWQLAPKYVAWIQKFHYMRRLLEARVNILALDSDVVATADPYPHLRRFGEYTMVTAYDTKGGFANINVGIVYTQNASVGGAVHALFTEFERRVGLGLRMPPPKREGKRESLAVKLFWDQNLFNKVLLSKLIGREAFLPDDADAAWTRAHAPDLRLVGTAACGRTRSAEVLSPCHGATGGWKPIPTAAAVAAPASLTVRAPWYPRRAAYKGSTIPSLGFEALAAPGATHSGGTSHERVLLAPPWLISADNSLGHRYKHWCAPALPPAPPSRRRKATPSPIGPSPHPSPTRAPPEPQPSPSRAPPSAPTPAVRIWRGFGPEVPAQRGMLPGRSPGRSRRRVRVAGSMVSAPRRASSSISSASRRVRSRASFQCACLGTGTRRRCRPS